MQHETMKAVFQLIFLFNLVDNLYCNDNSINVRIKRTMLKDMRHKWTFPIEYTTNYPVNLATVQKALNILQNETCITFTKVDAFTGPGLNYYYGSGCLSFIGKTSDTYPQDISLGWNCDHVAVVLHETAHALGVIHEMNRPDRYSYVDIYDQNMNPAQAFNFVRNPANKSITYGLKYDYGSVMHYDRTAGSVNRQLVTVPKNRHYINTIGQTTEMGFNDVKQLNLYYCNHKCKNKLNCKVGGYPNPHKCTECKCPRFYTGRLCEKVLKSDSGCGKTKFVARNNTKVFTMQGSKSCYIQIVTSVGYKVKMTILDATLTPSYVCQPNSGLEVKYLGDKSVSGIVFCGKVSNKTITSEKHVVVMRFVGKALTHNISVKYQRVKA